MAYTETEQRILDMWPRYEDGKLVWFGDQYEDWNGMNAEVAAVKLEPGRFNLLDHEDYPTCFGIGEHVKRPAPKVLDADGVEIKVGDTVWHHSGFAHGVVTSIDASSLISTVRYSNGYAEFRDAAKDLTHVQPDSWERLEKDATMSAWSYRDKYGLAVGVSDGECIPTTVAFALDLVRRAKALAEKEAAR